MTVVCSDVLEGAAPALLAAQVKTVLEDMEYEKHALDVHASRGDLVLEKRDQGGHVDEREVILPKKYGEGFVARLPVHTEEGEARNI